MLTEASATTHHILLSIHHAILDGLSQVVIAQTILNFYSKLIYSTIKKVYSLPVLSSIEKMLPGKMNLGLYQNQLAALYNIRGMFAPLPYSSPWKTGDNVSTRLVICDFDFMQTERIIAFCKEHQLKVNALIAAALLLAGNQVERGGIAHAGIHHAYNLRNMAVPPVGAENVGCFVNTVLTIHPSLENETLLSLAKTIQTQLQENMHIVGITPKIFNVTMMRQGLVEHESSLASKTHFTNGYGISNWGNVFIQDDPRSLKLLAIHRGSAKHSFFPFFLHIATINGRINATFSFAEPFFHRSRGKQYADDSQSVSVKNNRHNGKQLFYFK